MKFFKKQFKRKDKAFTLVESLVSTAIILIAIIGPLSLILNSVNSIIQNKNRIIASYLAEETVEDFRAFRDGFVLACSDIYIEYDSYGDISGGRCERDANLPINSSYFKNSDGEIDYTNRKISWKLFTDSISNVTGQSSYLDRRSFDFNNLSSLVSLNSCYLTLNTVNGYSCSGSASDLFERTINVTRVSEGAIKIEISVRYAISKVFGLEDKYVRIVEYIYER